jgi:hypothetical protein
MTFKLSDFQKKVYEFDLRLDRAALVLPEGFSVYKDRFGRFLFNGESLFVVCPFFDGDAQMYYATPVKLKWSETEIADELRRVVEKARIVSAKPETWHRVGERAIA